VDKDLEKQGGLPYYELPSSITLKKGPVAAFAKLARSEKKGVDIDAILEEMRENNKKSKGKREF